MRDDTGEPTTLKALNEASEAQFVAILGGMVEHSPWVAEVVSRRRPFASMWSLHRAMFEQIRCLGEDRKVALLRLHPALAGREASEGTMTDASNAEQRRVGLLALDSGMATRLKVLNQTYEERFGFPFIVALRRHRNLDSIFASFERRIQRDREHELQENIGQIGEVLRGRLGRRLATPLGWLSTHVLDGHAGLPACGMDFELASHDNGAWVRVGSGRTGEDGCADDPLLVDHGMVRGVFQIEFQVGDYFRRMSTALPDRPFLDVVPIRLGIDDPDRHYHVPLCCTPWAYSSCLDSRV